MVSIPACHAGDRGSIPRLGVYFFLNIVCLLVINLYFINHTIKNLSEKKNQGQNTLRLKDSAPFCAEADLNIIQLKDTNSGAFLKKGCHY